MAQLNFNAAEVQPLDSFEAIPAGTYEAVITDSEMKPTKSGTGSYLEITVEIISGEFQGRKVWARLNLANQNVKAVEIARRELSSICRAVNVMNPGDSAELHNIPFLVVVKKVKRDDDTYTNEIGGWKNKSEAAPQTAAAPTTPVQAAQATATQGKAPWSR
jgi:hypothetical protein